MIIKIPQKRRDTRSSFAQLTHYITKDFDKDDSPSLSKIVNYITRDDAILNTDKTIAVQIGNVNSLRTAAKEMTATASQNHLVKDPVFHYILSWDKSDTPSLEAMLSASKMTIEKLGLSEHQYVIAIHGNTENKHAHIAVNRIHPVTKKSHHLAWVQKELHLAAREIELHFNWQHDNGIFNVVLDELGNKTIVRNTHTNSSVKKAEMDMYSDKESFLSYVKENITPIIKTKFKEMQSWQDLHQVLSEFEVKIEASHHGLTLIGEDHIGIKCSSAMRFLKKTELEKRWGIFETRDNTYHNPKLHLETEKKEENKERQIKKEARQLKRMQLKNDYRQKKEEQFKKFKTVLLPLQKNKQKAIDEVRQNTRKKIRQLTGTPIEKELYKTVLRLQEKDKIQLIQSHYQEEKAKLKENLSPVTWRQYLKEEAKQGNEAAISALRGIRYREKRQEKEKTEPFITAIQLPAQPIPQISERYQWKLENRQIIFINPKTNERAFTDNGFNVILDRKIISDEDLKEALIHAHRKWGDQLILRGGNAIFRKRVQIMATRMQIALNGKIPEKSLNTKSRGLER